MTNKMRMDHVRPYTTTQRPVVMTDELVGQRYPRVVGLPVAHATILPDPAGRATVPTR